MKHHHTGAGWGVGCLNLRLPNLCLYMEIPNRSIILRDGSSKTSGNIGSRRRFSGILGRNNIS